MSAAAYAKFAGEATRVLCSYERAFERECWAAKKTNDGKRARDVFDASLGYSVLLESGALFRLALEMGGEVSVETPE